MSKTLQAIRGMNDLLPDQSSVWRYFEETAATLLGSYGYRQIRTPILEFTDLFKRSIGEVTDIVEKEMYTFADRNGDSLTLRPENTASCVRAAIEHGLVNGGQTQKLWYSGPMFRHERPQKGRYRQFHQMGAELFNFAGPEADAELIAMTWRLWKRLGIVDAVALELNTLGSLEARSRYREALVDYLSARSDALDEDSRRRLHSNPLRVLDSKVEQTQQLLEDAPALADYLDEDSRSHFAAVCARLGALGLKYRINPRLVRGLDYYNKTVFEWVTDCLGAQSTVCAGGRYDGLFELIGAKPVPCVGFAMGVERLILLLQTLEAIPADVQPCPHLYIVALGEEAEREAFRLVERLRDDLPRLCILLNASGGSFKSQLKKADKSGAQVALVLGEDELKEGIVAVKPLRDNTPQQNVTWKDLTAHLQSIFPVEGPRKSQE